jgi:hypothetical protein
MRRESVATLRVRNLYANWGLRGVPAKGGKTHDIPLPAVVSQYLNQYLAESLAIEHGPLQHPHVEAPAEISFAATSAGLASPTVSCRHALYS